MIVIFELIEVFISYGGNRDDVKKIFLMEKEIF